MRCGIHVGVSTAAVVLVVAVVIVFVIVILVAVIIVVLVRVIAAILSRLIITIIAFVVIVVLVGVMFLGALRGVSRVVRVACVCRRGVVTVRRAGGGLDKATTVCGQDS